MRQGSGDKCATMHQSREDPLPWLRMALPVIKIATGDDATYRESMMPLSLALADRCDACLHLHVGDASAGTDDAVARFEARGRRVFQNLAQVTGATRS